MEAVGVFGETTETAPYRIDTMILTPGRKIASVHLARDRQRPRVLLASGKRTNPSVYYEKILSRARTRVICEDSPPVKV
jgi:hypothetical protein